MLNAQIKQYAQNRQCQLCNRIGSPNTVQLEEKGKGPQSDWEKQARLDVDQQAGDAGLFHSVKALMQRVIPTIRKEKAVMTNAGMACWAIGPLIPKRVTI